MSAEVANACRNSRPVWQWQMDNCCETSDGQKASCMNVAVENLRISAMEGNGGTETSAPPVRTRSFAMELIEGRRFLS